MKRSDWGQPRKAEKSKRSNLDISYWYIYYLTRPKVVLLGKWGDMRFLFSMFEHPTPMKRSDWGVGEKCGHTKEERTKVEKFIKREFCRTPSGNRSIKMVTTQVAYFFANHKAIKILFVKTLCSLCLRGIFLTTKTQSSQRFHKGCLCGSFF